MAIISLDLGSVSETERIVKCLCAAGGYTGDTAGQQEFAKKVVTDFIAVTVCNVEISRRPVVEPVAPAPVMIT
jgi:hypothetical protein